MRTALNFRHACWVSFCFFAMTPLITQGEVLKETQNQLLNDLKYLSSDDLQGRGVGTEGLNRAADFIRDEFEKAGLDVTKVDGGAFQTFPLVTGTKLGKPNVLTFVSPKGKEFPVELDQQFQVCSFGGTGKFEGEAVFLGYGIDAEEYSDLPKGFDLKGKVAIIMRRNPQQGNPHSPFAGAHGGVSRHAALTSKLSVAFRGGASAVVFVNEPYSAKNSAIQLKKQIDKAATQLAEVEKQLADIDQTDKKKLAAVEKKMKGAKRYLQTLITREKNAEPDPLMKFGYGGDGRRKSIPVVHLKQDVANNILKESLGKSLEELESAIDKDLKPQTAVLSGWKIQGETAVSQVSNEVKNVIGVLEGEGPHANETIVIGAHYDHVGMGGAGSLAPGSKEVHNGADDNGSGTVCLLEMARRFGAMKKKPSRRLVFMAFTAEERGLIGSDHYVKNPIFPLKDTVAMFNMDMVGRLRNEKLIVYGTGTAKRWDALIKELGKEHGFDFAFKPEGFGPSDHASFYRVKIPVLHFFTDTHTDYHRPSDDWPKINVEGMNRVVDLLEEIVLDTLAKDDRPEYVAVKGRANIQRSGSRPYFGSIPDFGNNAEGYAISGVAPGSPSDKGGLKGGDVIVQLGKQKISGLDDFDLALRKFKPGDQVDVTVLRKEKKVTLKVVLDKAK